MGAARRARPVRGAVSHTLPSQRWVHGPASAWPCFLGHCLGGRRGGGASGMSAGGRTSNQASTNQPCHPPSMEQAVSRARHCIQIYLENRPQLVAVHHLPLPSRPCTHPNSPLRPNIPSAQDSVDPAAVRGAGGRMAVHAADRRHASAPSKHPAPGDQQHSRVTESRAAEAASAQREKHPPNKPGPETAQENPAAPGGGVWSSSSPCHGMDGSACSAGITNVLLPLRSQRHKKAKSK